MKKNKKNKAENGEKARLVLYRLFICMGRITENKYGHGCKHTTKYLFFLIFLLITHEKANKQHVSLVLDTFKVKSNCNILAVTILYKKINLVRCKLNGTFYKLLSLSTGQTTGGRGHNMRSPSQPDKCSSSTRRL